MQKRLFCDSYLAAKHNNNTQKPLYEYSIR
jgi:hypothetical protein